jgi:hypothetical protein
VLVSVEDSTGSRPDPGDSLLTLPCLGQAEIEEFKLPARLSQAKNTFRAHSILPQGSDRQGAIAL